MMEVASPVRLPTTRGGMRYPQPDEEGFAPVGLTAEEAADWPRHQRASRWVRFAAAAVCVVLGVTLAITMASRKSKDQSSSSSSSSSPGAKPGEVRMGKHPGDVEEAKGMEAFTMDIRLPEYEADYEDAWLCAATTLPADMVMSLLGVEFLSSTGKVHHSKLFGCEAPASKDKVWNCIHASPCASGVASTLYAWGNGAPALKLPDGAGFSIGSGTTTTIVVLQMHFSEKRPPGDQSGLRLHLADQTTPLAAGMLSFNSDFQLAPGQELVSTTNECCYSGWEPLQGFAMRVHAHALGREVRMDRKVWGSGNREVVGSTFVSSKDPQDPQAFYPVQPAITLLPGDRLTTTCSFDTSKETEVVKYGWTHNEEMCNAYLMLYGQLPYFSWCETGNLYATLEGPGGLPTAAVKLMVVKATNTGVAWSPPTSVHVSAEGLDGWAVTPGAPVVEVGVGQVGGVANGYDGTVWVFHRGSRVWDSNTYDDNTNQMRDKSLLDGPMVLQLDDVTGELLHSWGSRTFSMPHMITRDWDGNIWITDTGLHQAIKFDPKGIKLMELGKRFTPGSDEGTFCKPTQVAVARDGSIFVSDGYCNPHGRVVKYGADGRFQFVYRLPPAAVGDTTPPLPHSLVLMECGRMMLVADRERGRVVAIDVDDNSSRGIWELRRAYGLPYALTLGPYGSVLVLLWDRDGSGAVHVGVIDPYREGGKLVRAWEVPEVFDPHSVALVVNEEELGLLIGETRKQGSRVVRLAWAKGKKGGGEGAGINIMEHWGGHEGHGHR